MRNRPPRHRIVERFTFRTNGRELTVDAAIDTGAERTYVTPAIVEALGLDCFGHETIGLASGSAIATVHRCEVVWTLYASQRYGSTLEVLCLESSREPLIGMDFLDRHELGVDMEHGGLVGFAPESAEPLTGGGYVINASPGLVRKLNYERFKAAKPGDVLLPHPAWRFRRPGGIKGPLDRRDEGENKGSRPAEEREG